MRKQWEGEGRAARRLAIPHPPRFARHPLLQCGRGARWLRFASHDGARDTADQNARAGYLCGSLRSCDHEPGGTVHGSFIMKAAMASVAAKFLGDVNRYSNAISRRRSRKGTIRNGAAVARLRKDHHTRMRPFCLGAVAHLAEAEHPFRRSAALQDAPRSAPPCVVQIQSCTAWHVPMPLRQTEIQSR